MEPIGLVPKELSGSNIKEIESVPSYVKFLLENRLHQYVQFLYVLILLNAKII